MMTMKLKEDAPTLHPYQTEAVRELNQTGKHYLICPAGSGKTAVMLRHLQDATTPHPNSPDRNHPNKVLIVTTASKARTDDFEREADLWCPQWRDTLEEFTVISWHRLRKWQLAQSPNALARYAVAFDECARLKGYTTQMALAGRYIAAHAGDWTGYTATPGDKWIDFLTYFTTTPSTSKIKNKTQFLRDFCVVQTFKGFPEIVKYTNQTTLQKRWDAISVRPDTAQVFAQLPPHNHRVIHFPTPPKKIYAEPLRTRITPDGEPLDTQMALAHYARQASFTKEKKQWLAEFLENLGEPCVFFVNYKEEEDAIADIAKKALPSNARVWRIDGTHHEIPTEDTLQSDRDVVVAHYLSGGEGLNLQFMRVWVSSTPNYSYSTSVQARGRIRRLGQTRPQLYYYLKTDGTIEEAIYRSLKNKHDFSEDTWQPLIDDNERGGSPA